MLPPHTLAPDVSTASSTGWLSEDHFLPKENGKAGPRARVQQATVAHSARGPPSHGHWGLPHQDQKRPQVLLNTTSGGCNPAPRSSFRCDLTVQPKAQGDEGDPEALFRATSKHAIPPGLPSVLLWTQSALPSKPLPLMALDLAEDDFPVLGPF